MQQVQEEKQNSFFPEEEEVEEAEEPKKPAEGHSWLFYAGTFVLAAALALTVHHAVFEEKEEDGTIHTTEYGIAAENMPSTITMDGTVYSYGVTFQDLVNDGWEYSFEDDVTANDLQHLVDDDIYVVTLHRGSVTAYASFWSDEDIPIDVCKAAALSVTEGDTEVLPCGIVLGMSREETEEILDRNNREYSRSEWYTTYGNERCDYYEIDSEDGHSYTAVLICEDGVEDVRVSWPN